MADCVFWNITFVHPLNEQGPIPRHGRFSSIQAQSQPSRGLQYFNAQSVLCSSSSPCSEDGGNRDTHYLLSCPIYLEVPMTTFETSIRVGLPSWLCSCSTCTSVLSVERAFMIKQKFPEAPPSSVHFSVKAEVPCGTQPVLQKQCPF